MTEQKKLRQYTSNGQVFTEFGTLVEVYDGSGFWHMKSDRDQYISMKKVYMSWASVYLMAQDLIGKRIIYETGASSSSREYFRDIYPENDEIEFYGGVFDRLPEGAGAEGINELIKTRLRLNKTRYRLSNALDEKQMLETKLEQRTASETNEAAKAAEQLDANWQEFMNNPVRSLLVAGQALNKSKLPKKIDISFAMRMNIDITKRDTKRINIKVLEKIKGTNKIRCLLTDYGDTECVIPVKQSDHNNTRGEWAAVTVLNTLPGWWNVEDSKAFRDVKNQRKPIEYFLDKHHEMMSAVVANVK